MLQSPAPLFAGVDFHAGLLFDTADLDEARLLCGRVFNPHDLAVVGPGQRLRARMEHLKFGALSLNRLTWGATVAVDPDRLATYYLLSMPLRGKADFQLGGRPTEVSRRQAGIVNAGERFCFTASEDFEQVVVRVEREAVDAAWCALSGTPPREPIAFECGIAIDGPVWRAVEPVMQLLARRARDGCDSAAAPFLDARLHEMLLATLLLHQPHRLSGALLGPAARDASSPIARRAERWLLEHLDEPLTVSAVARACGTSVRSLQSAFQQTRGCGPMQWLREQRLHRVREALLASAEVRPSVTDTALRLGFTHLGEFSRAYRHAFGETPTQTLRKRC